MSFRFRRPPKRSSTPCLIWAGTYERRGGATTSFSVPKRSLDAASGVTGWRLHDLRRTARSLMSRAGVDSDIAERCLAHTIGGVRGVYDRYAYHAEKKHAFEALAAQIEHIVNPPADVVVPIRRQSF
jgi:integrase